MSQKVITGECQVEVWGISGFASVGSSMIFVASSLFFRCNFGDFLTYFEAFSFVCFEFEFRFILSSEVGLHECVYEDWRYITPVFIYSM